MGEVKELVERLQREADFAENNQFDKGAALFRAAADTLQSQERRIGELEAGDTYAAWQQKRGMALDAIDEAVNVYDDYMSDDDYDAQDCLDRIIRRLREKQQILRSTLTTGGGHDGQG